MIHVEPFDICSVVTGSVRLDGGAMFGIVPKVLWENCTDVDDQNRIFLATRTLLAVDRSTSRVILVDSGCGTKWEPKAAARYSVQYDPEAIPTALAGLGLTPDDVTDVIVTHVHFDHNGGLTYWRNELGGELRLCYPKAVHWIHSRHLEHARNPTVKDKASFITEDFEPLAQAGVLRLLEGEPPKQAIDGVNWFLSHGHTPYQLLPMFGSTPQKLLFVGDVVPTVNHLRLPWVMAFDLEPLRTISEKKAVFSQCMCDGLWLAFPHDSMVGGVVLDGSVDRPIVARSLDLEPVGMRRS